MRRRLRSDLWSTLTILAVMSALVGTVVSVRQHGNEKDSLRQAQIALATVPGALRAVVLSPQAMLAGAAVDPSEYPLSEKLRTALTGDMTDLNRFWHAPMARALKTHAALISARTGQLMGLIAQHRLRSAKAVHDSYVQPLANKLAFEIATAKGELARKAGASDRAAWNATLAILGGTGVLLVLLVAGLASSRRRRLCIEIEQGVLREGTRRLQALVEHGSDMITVVRPDTTVIYQAGAVESVLGYEPQQLEGAQLTKWLDPDDAASLLALCATQDSVSGELRLRHRDGGRRTCEVHATSLLDDPAWHGIVLNIWDLSERKALEERLRHQAFHDALTGLPNRVLALDRAQQMLARAKRHSAPIAGLCVDIDGFKHINDRFGHAAGDELLRLVAERLSSIVRDADTAARLGGDEFVVLLEGSALDAGPELVAERLLELLSRPYDMHAEIGHQVSITASIGVALGERGTADKLLRDADVALYEAKRAGRNRYVLFTSSMQTAAQDRLTLEMDLTEALENNQFFLLYQPTIDLRSERVIGVEALIRWRHPTRGIVAPGQFIAIAEESGQIVPIGRWVLEEACRQAATWHEHGLMLRMSVNVSGRQLDDDELIEDVRRALGDSGLDPQALTLEVTETMLMRDASASANRLASLKELGVRLAIDDFGTGYSSLAYLRQFRVDALKIDRSFVGGIGSSKESMALIHTLVQLGKALNIETLAEGIEEPAQLRALQRERCDQGQGFLFARPLSPLAVEELMSATGFTESHALAVS